MARVYLAWILIKKGELVEASRLVESTRRGPRGSARDFAIVAESALMIEHGRPQEAIKALRKLQGKIIDPLERFFATQQLVVATLSARLYAEALIYMVDWLEQARPDQRASVRASIRSRLRLIPPAALEHTLGSLEPTGDDISPALQIRAEQKSWLFERISQHLAERALEEQNVQLALRLINQNPALSRQEGSEELVRLSTGGRAPARIDGQAVGLVLSTGDSILRRRSTAVATGLNMTLNAQEKRVSLFSAEDDGTPGALAAALLELTTQGASLLIAGIDESSSTRAARAAERLRVPLLLLHPQMLASPKYTFGIGVSDRHQLRLLEAELQRRGILNSVTLAHQSSYCNAEIQSIARPSFPIRQWKELKVGALLVMHRGACAQALLDATQTERFSPLFVLGLEAAHATYPLAQLLALRAGHFPFSQEDALVADWVNHMSRTPSWYETLGRDAALIAKWAFRDTPVVHSSDNEEVKRIHELIRRRILAFKSEQLWSSKEAHFDSNLTLTRQISAQ